MRTLGVVSALIGSMASAVGQGLPDRKPLPVAEFTRAVGDARREAETCISEAATFYAASNSSAQDIVIAAAYDCRAVTGRLASLFFQQFNDLPKGEAYAADVVKGMNDKLIFAIVKSRMPKR